VVFREKPLTDYTKELYTYGALLALFFTWNISQMFEELEAK